VGIRLHDESLTTLVGRSRTADAEDLFYYWYYNEYVKAARGGKI
jgi:hypothetical protein